jgi:hypothetical protein
MTKRKRQFCENVYIKNKIVERIKIEEKKIYTRPMSLFRNLRKLTKNGKINY